MHSNQYECSRTWRRITFVVAVCCALLSVISAEDSRWVWGKSSRRNGNYAVGGIDDGFFPGPGGPGGSGVLGGDGVKFGLNQGGYKPGGISVYKPGYPRPLPPPVYEGPGGGPGGIPGRPGILAGPGGPIGPIGGPGIGGPGFGGPGIGGPGIGGPGFGGPGIGGPGIGGPGIGGPGVGPISPGGHGGQGTGPGVLTGPIPSWEQERLDALGVGHRYISFDTCRCVHSFNCKSPGLSFGKCDKDKQYCCNGIRPGAVGHGVRKPPIGAGYPPPPPPLGPGGYGPGPIGEPGYGPEPYPGDFGFERSAKIKKA